MRKLYFSVCLLAWILAAHPIVYAQPPSPKLIEPCDGENVSTDVLFKWKASSGTDSYTLQILNPINQTTVFETETSQNQHQLSSGTLSMSTPYYWQIKAAGASGESDWSDTWGFLTLPTAIDPFQMEEDSDKDGISNAIEDIIKTNINKKTLFVRPMKRTGPGPNDFIYWDGFVSLFPDSPPGRAKIVPFEEAGIEIVVIGDPDPNNLNPYEPMRDFYYNPATDFNKPPCTIMEIKLESVFNAYGKPVARSDYHYGHTFLLRGERENETFIGWSLAKPAYTDSNPHQDEYNCPWMYPYPIDRYFDEGAYAKIDLEQFPYKEDCSQEQVAAGQCPKVTECSDFPEECTKASSNNFPDSATSLPFDRSTDNTVEFNAITFDYYGKIIRIDLASRGKPYFKTDVKAKLVIHEMGHGLLSAVEEEHCENPCCIMYRYMIDWEQLLFGPFCDAGKAETCSQACIHSPGGGKDIRLHSVVHNEDHTTVPCAP